MKQYVLILKEKNNHNMAFPAFKLSASNNNIL